MKITKIAKATLCHFSIMKNEIFSDKLFIPRYYEDRRTKRIITLINNGYLQAEKIINKRTYYQVSLTEKGRNEISL